MSFPLTVTSVGWERCPPVCAGVTYQAITPPRIDSSNAMARRILELDERNPQALFLISVGKHRSGDVVRAAPLLPSAPSSCA